MVSYFALLPVGVRREAIAVGGGRISVSVTGMNCTKKGIFKNFI